MADVTSVEHTIALNKTLKEFLEGEEVELKIPFVAMFQIDTQLNILGYEREDVDDLVNGWDIDWHFKYTKEGADITLSGSVWNSSKIKILK